MTEGYIAGTIIKTPLGGTPIEQIAIGDDILSIHNNEIIVSKVTAIHKNINSIIQIQTAKNALSGSVDHLIKTFNGYVPLKSLNIGDAVIMHNLTTECELILNKKQLEAQTIYNLSVSNQHTNYSFLANNFIVHNKMYCEGTAKVYMHDSDGVQVGDEAARCEFENCLTQSPCLEKLFKCCCSCACVVEFEFYYLEEYDSHRCNGAVFDILISSDNTGSNYQSIGQINLNNESDGGTRKCPRIPVDFVKKYAKQLSKDCKTYIQQKLYDGIVPNCGGSDPDIRNGEHYGITSVGVYGPKGGLFRTFQIPNGSQWDEIDLNKVCQS